MIQKKTALSLAVGAVFAGGVLASSVASAADNPFTVKLLDSGYQVAQADKPADPKPADAKPANAAPAEKKVSDKAKKAKRKAKKKAEGKCGEGKCGGDKKKAAEGADKK